MKMINNNIVLLLLFLLPLITQSKHHRILHEPLFPIQWTPPPPQSDPAPVNPSPFFPDPPPQSGSIQTPNSLAPISQQPKHSNSKSKLILIIVAVSSFALFVLFAFFFFKKRTSRSPSDTHKLIGSEDGTRRRQMPMPDLLYLGTIEPHSGEQRRRASESSLGSPYRKLSSERAMMEIHHPSPDLQPLPPLMGPPPIRRVSSLSNEGATFSSDDDGFYTAHRSLASMTSESPSSPRTSGQNKPRSRRTSPRMQFKDSSPSDSQIKHAISMPNMAPPPPPPPPPPRIVKSTRPPLPPPLPSSRRQLLRPLPADRIDVGFPPSGICNGSNDVDFENGDDLDEDAKPKLKQLHWDKVRASSDRAMVWDQMKSSSFKLNEDMIETLFMSNGTNPPPQVTVNRKHVQPQVKQENRMLDPKKSQNIAILLRALNVTREDVTDGLLRASPVASGLNIQPAEYSALKLGWASSGQAPI